MRNIFPYLILVMLVTACTQKPALVIDKSRHFYGPGNNYNQRNAKENHATAKTAANKIKVKKGDTVYKIAKLYKIPVRDLIIANNLAPPYDLASGFELSIPSPLYHQVQEGETIYSISRKYSVDMNSIIETNDLKSPYELNVGQKLRLARYNETPVKTAEHKSEFKVIEAEPQDKTNEFSWPIKGEVLSKFGPKKAGLYNDGINIKCDEGTEVKASEDGVVAYVGNELRGYGNLIIIKHANGWITAYAHLSKPMVERGVKVAKLQVIGLSGSTGRVNSPQLYFGLRHGRSAVNPETYLKN